MSLTGCGGSFSAEDDCDRVNRGSFIRSRTVFSDALSTSFGSSDSRVRGLRIKLDRSDTGDVTIGFVAISGVALISLISASASAARSLAVKLRPLCSKEEGRMGLAPGPRYEPLRRRGAGGSGEAGMTEMDGAVGDGCGVETFRVFGRSRDDPLPSSFASELEQ